jgi:glycosyltransferase involved in cell wall biosynthesis
VSGSGLRPVAEEARVSCVIPAYNAERYLREAVDSAIRQSLPPFEIIIVDDGSTDGTVELAARLAGPICVVRQAHAGSSTARNTGVAVSTGELLAFLDADDVWEPDKLRLQVELFRSHLQPTIVSAYTKNFWSEDLREQEEQLRDQWVARPHPGINASSVLVSRALFDQVGGFDPSLSHGEVADWLNRIRAAGAGFAVHPSVLVRRRIHAANKSRTVAKRDRFFMSLKAVIDANRRCAKDPARPSIIRGEPP